LIGRPDIHVVFTDIEMPGSMDGIKLAAFVRDRWPPVHIIVCSGRAGMDANALPTGCLFVAKPPDRVRVVATMREMTTL
jgi:DNA-binding LytR/AlgR family response regulator